MFVVVAGVFNTWWTGRVTAQRRGAGFRLGTFWIGHRSRTSVGDKVKPPPLSRLVAFLGGGGTVTISVGAVLLLLFWSTWLFVLTDRHVLRCHHGLAPPTLLFYLLILPSHLHSILSSLSPVFKMPSCLLFFVSP